MDTDLLNIEPQVKSGDLLAGRFRIGRILGRGANGVVYRATDVQINNMPVALKFVSFQLQAEKKMVERLLREVILTRRLRHDHIVTVFEVLAVEKSAPIVVMELVDGGSLADFIKGDEWKRVPLQERVELLRQISSALGYAHSEGIVHRDVKPENILLTANGDAKIADFGLARCFEDDQRLTKTGASLGTPYYMSPEQFRGEDAGPAADIYSFGILAYELLTGRKPFNEDVYFALALKHLVEPLPRFTDAEHLLPSWVYPMLLKCTAKNPVDRYSSMQEVTAVLERECVADSGSARSDAVTRLKRKATRSRALRTSLCAVRYAAAIFGVFVLLQLTVFIASQLSPDMKERMASVTLSAERVLGSTVLFALKRMIGVEYQVDKPNDIFHAIENGDANVSYMKALVWAGADLNVRDAKGDTPLCLTTRAYGTVSQMMLERGANINARCKDGNTPFLRLITAGLFGSADIKRILPRVNLRIKNDSELNAIHIALNAGAVSILEAILEDPRSVDLINEPDSNKLTPLLYAASYYIPVQPKTVELLLKHGADASRLVNGSSALHIAISRHMTDIALAIAENADPSALTIPDINNLRPADYLRAQNNPGPDELRLLEILEEAERKQNLYK